VSNFGLVLRELREKRSLSVNQLALYSKVSASTISKIENNLRGIPKPETIQKLARGLKIQYEELMHLAGHIEEKERTNGTEVNNAKTDPKLRFFYELERDLGINLSDPQVQKELKRAAKIVFGDED
jgi:transcriptional regulator with XRE-family HTH domain